MTSLLKDVINPSSEGTESAYGKEFFCKQLEEHLHLLDSSNRSAFKIKEEIEESPRDYVSKMSSGALIKGQKSDLRARKKGREGTVESEADDSKAETVYS